MAKAPLAIEDLDWDTLTDDQLKEVMRQAKKRSSARFNRKLEEFREDAREEGFEVTLTPIGQTGREEPREEPRRRRRSADSEGKQDQRTRLVIPKFQNPDNPSELWSGRGIEPKWLKDKQAQGYQRSELLIHYRNPDNPRELWAWEGKNSKTPAWLVETVDQGLDPLQFAVPPAEREA
jgi:DNA-binding protein H-NS